MKLHPTQAIVAKDNHDYRVVVCGRQWGKTTLAVEEMTACGYSRGGRDIGYLASTFDQARNIAWVMLKEKTKSVWAKPPNESRLELTIHTQDKGESRLTLGGYENIETYRGRQFDLLVPDEVALMRNFEYTWNAILEPTLAFRKGKALFLGTPKGFDHLYDLYQKGQDPNNKFYKSWRFTSYDNPFLPKERIDQAKITSTEDYFAQEYLADFRRYSGAIFKSFTREINVIPSFEIPLNWSRGRGFDFGSDDPTASLRIAIDLEDNWFYERTYKRSDTIKGHADILRAQDYNYGFIPVWGDPTGGQWFVEFQNQNFTIQHAIKEDTGQKSWVNFGYELVDNRFKPIPGHTVYLPDGRVIENAPKAFILDTPENQAFIKEVEAAEWKRNNDGQTQPVIDDVKDPEGHFDLIACARYFAVSYRKQKPSIHPFNKRKWAI